jgi:acyl-CoA synthetase (AMP-forming)/AMP-acid ligase II
MISDIVPDNDALICGDEIVTWKEYDDESSKIASALSAAGLQANSKAGLYLNNSNEYLIAQNAIFKIGGIPINVNYRYVAEELIYLLDNSDVNEIDVTFWGRRFRVVKNPSQVSSVEMKSGEDFLLPENAVPKKLHLFHLHQNYLKDKLALQQHIYN